VRNARRLGKGRTSSSSGILTTLINEIRAALEPSGRFSVSPCANVTQRHQPPMIDQLDVDLALVA
jgi:hypothetical protein